MKVNCVTYLASWMSQYEKVNRYVLRTWMIEYE